MSLQRPLPLTSQGRARPLRPRQGAESFAAARETQSQKPKAIPGYRGFIRGSQHYYGLTDGEVSRRAPSHNFAPTPAGNPHEEAGPRVATESLDSAAPARVLGYSGHIPGRVSRYAETFGRTVEKLLRGAPQVGVSLKTSHRVHVNHGNALRDEHHRLR